jgi:carbamoyl-phosphate synthase large subunit
MKNILILSAGRRVSLIRFFKKELKKLKVNSRIICEDFNPTLSPACQYNKKFIKLPQIKDKLFISELKSQCLKNKISVIIPTIDTGLKKLSKAKKEFKKLNINIIISDLALIEKSTHKAKTKFLFNEIGLDYPKIYNASKEIKYPCFAKPFDGSASKNNFKIENSKELNSIKRKHKNLVYMKYVDIKKFDEYTIDLYYDKNYILKSLIARKRIEVRSGEVSKSITNKKLSNLLWNNFKNLKNAIGTITGQVFINNKNGMIIGIEINPRFGGGYPLSHIAKANFIRNIINEYLKNKSIKKNMLWKDNLLMLRYDAEIIC